jgi:glutathione S-transferase
MLTLYHAPQTRSSRFIWLLEEIGEPYNIEIVNIRRREATTVADPKNPHPHGKVPALDHDGVLIYESAAICLYLSDAFPKADLGPRVGDKDRGPYLTWLAYYTGVVEPAFVGKALNFPEPNSTMGWAPVPAVMNVVNSALDRGPYLLGQKFSTADILYGSSFILFTGSPLLAMTPALTEYCERLKARPAWQRALAKDSG